MTDLISRLRRLRGETLTLAVTLLLVPVLPGAALAIGAPLLPATVGAGILGGIALLAGRLTSRLTDFILATAIMGQAMLLAAVFGGHAFQIDMHMMFFAALAIVSTIGRVSVLVWACVITAVHHLALTLLLPALVYPSVDLWMNVLRTGIHGAIVVIEGAVLAIAMVQRNDVMTEVERTSARLETESRMAADAQAESVAAQARADEVIARMRAALGGLAQRDMTCRIDDPFPAQYEVLRRDFNQTMENLRGAFRGVRDLTGAFLTESAELSRAVEGLSQRTEAQAQSLSEMTRTTSDLVEALGQTAKQASDAASSADDARSSAVRGGEVTERAIAAMRKIEDSSRQIAQIVDLIDDVSFQTNLLALNAGVEAARAGEAGKGFAVVAAEVRQLAHSTSGAAAGIRKLISDSSEQVETGADLVDSVGRHLEEIKALIARASDLSGAISTRNIAQSSAVTQLDGMVRDVDRDTQTTAHMGEELAERTQRMETASQKLSSDMAGFIFDAAARAPSRRAAAS